MSITTGQRPGCCGPLDNGQCSISGDVAKEPRVLVATWTPVRDAIEYAYKELGREKEPDGFPTPDWNLAALVYRHARSHETTCTHCQTPLRWGSAYRCFDCKASLCENCALEHFGPNHPERSRVAHGSPAIEADNAAKDKCIAELEARECLAEETLRELSSFVGRGLLSDSDPLDIDEAGKQIRIGINNLIEVEVKREHGVFCPHCNPCRHAEQIAALTAENADLRARIASLEAKVKVADVGVCAFKEWYDAIWLGDEEHGQTLPNSGPQYDLYMEGYTLAYGAWNAALAKLREPT